MFNFKSYLTIIILFVHTLYGDELFFPKDIYLSLKTHKLQKDYEKLVKEDVGKRIECSLSYQTLDSHKYPLYSKILAKVVQEYKDEYNATDPKKMVLNDIKEMDYFERNSYDWEVSLFAITDKTLTVAINTRTYLGGAHGNSETIYQTYTLKDAKPISYDDIFKPHSDDKFASIIEEYYKKIKRFPKNANVKEWEGWLVENMPLPELDAITPTDDGLFVYYATYAFKPYPSGETKLLIPYDRLTSVINPKGIFTSYIKPKSKRYKRYINEHAYIESFISTSKHQVKIHINAINFTKDKHALLAISTPQFFGKNVIKSYDKSQFDSIAFYPKGSAIYNDDTRSNIKARYMLMELYDKDWKQNETKSFDITFKIPKRFDDFIFDIRFATFADMYHSLPLWFEGYISQQHFEVFREVVELKKTPTL